MWQFKRGLLNGLSFSPIETTVVPNTRAQHRTLLRPLVSIVPGCWRSLSGRSIKGYLEKPDEINCGNTNVIFTVSGWWIFTHLRFKGQNDGDEHRGYEQLWRMVLTLKRLSTTEHSIHKTRTLRRETDLLILWKLCRKRNSREDSVRWELVREKYLGAVMHYSKKQTNKP